MQEESAIKGELSKEQSTAKPKNMLFSNDNSQNCSCNDDKMQTNYFSDTAIFKNKILIQTTVVSLSSVKIIL